jgi:hypothetical protein
MTTREKMNGKVGGEGERGSDYFFEMARRRELSRPNNKGAWKKRV